MLNAEYTEDGETKAQFCAADLAAGITGALFNVDLDGKTYKPCAPAAGTQLIGGRGGASTSSSWVTATPT